MALIQMNLMSQSLMRTVPVNVILPADKLPFPGMPQREEKPYKTLYLLHGVLGNYTDWVSGTRILRYAEEHDLAVVMPSGDNAFYVDQKGGTSNYGEFVGRELVELTRKMFPLSRRREDTFLGGLSMGGYGALRNGLKYSDTFGAIVNLSGKVDVEDFAFRTEQEGLFIATVDYARHCFGELGETLMESDKNPQWLIRKLIREKKPIPDIYMACGDRDGLLGANRALSEFLTEQGVKHTFEVGPGDHEWDFWDTYIKKAIQWLPTEKNALGIGSGNVTAPSGK